MVSISSLFKLITKELKSSHSLVDEFVSLYLFPLECLLLHFGHPAIYNIYNNDISGCGGGREGKAVLNRLISFGIPKRRNIDSLKGSTTE